MRATHLIVLLIFLVSCAPQISETPFSENTVVPSATPEVVNTLTSTPVLPEKDVTSYRFRSWSEEDYSDFENLITGEIDNIRFDIPYFHIPKSVIVFQTEQLLKFPNSTSYEDTRWDVLINNPGAIIPNNDQDQDLMELFITEMLAKGMNIEEITREIKSHGVFVDNVIEVKNLVGNGKDGFVVEIRIPDTHNSIAFFAIFIQNGFYQVAKIRDWDISAAPAMGRYYDIYDVGDTNNNGKPELIVQIETCGSGIPGICNQSIYHIEWSEKIKEFNGVEFPVFWQTCGDFGSGPCEGKWEFSNINSKNALITSSYWYTRSDCPNLSVQRVSFWDGARYVLGSPEIVPPGNDLVPQCLLGWAETAAFVYKGDWTSDFSGTEWKNDLIVSIVESELKNWPKEADQIWGPASRDFVKFKLGIWHDLRGEADAVSILQELIDSPYLQEYDFVSRMAGVYLQSRENFGKTKACLDINDFYYAEFRKTIPEPSSYNNDKATLEYWGIVDWKGGLCNSDEMFSAELQSAKIMSSDLLIEWLEKSEFPVYETVPMDLDGNPETDFLVLMNTSRSESNNDLWVFFWTPNGYISKYIYNYFDTKDSEFNQLYIITVGNMPVHLLSVGDTLVAVRILPDTTVKVVLEEYGVKSYELRQETDPTRILINVDNNLDGKLTKIYQWDKTEESFVLQPSDFEVAQHEIETKLYHVRDYEGVTEYIHNFLSASPVEPKEISVCGIDIPNGCVYSPEWHIPYFRYIRGVAYEQLGQFDMARDAYYELWRDFPDNVFGVAASMKLQLVNP